MIIITVANIPRIDNLKKLIAEKGKNGVKVISLTPESYIALKQAYIEFKDYSEYINYEKSDQLFKLSQEWSRNWYKTKHIKALELKINNIVLPNICELSFHHFFAEALFSFEIAYRIIEKERPEQLFVEPIFGETLWKHGQSFNLNLINKSLIEQAKIRNIKINYQSKSDTDKIVPILLKNLQGFIMNLKHFRKRNKSTSKRRIFSSRTVNVLAFANSYIILNMLPLLKNIRTDRNFELFVSGKTTNNNINILSKNKIRFIKIDNLRNISNYIFVAGKSISYSSKWLKLRQNKHFRSYFTYRNASLWPILEGKFNFHFFYYFLIISFYILESQNLFKITKPKVILLMEGLTALSQVITKLAKLNNIPTVIMQHGLLGKLELRYETGDYFAVWGKEAKNIYLNAGLKPKNIIKTGYPLFDKYCHVKHISNLKLIEIKNKLKVNPQKKVLTILGTQQVGIGKLFSEPQHIFYQSVLNNLSDLKGFQIIIRTHPFDDMGYFKELSNILNLKIIIANNIALENLIRISDIIISQQTTAALEAILLKKPVIYLTSFEKSIWPSSFLETKSTINVNDIKMLQKIILDINSGKYNNKVRKNRMNLIKNYLSNNDGKATTRTVNLIANLSNI